MSLAQLPPEIYSAILEHIPPHLLQATTFTLLCATPASPIPLHHLYQCVRIAQPKQLVLLDRRLRLSPQFIPWIHELYIESWNVDADIVVNLVRKLEPYVLRIYVGPRNFSPEHLEEMLHYKLGQRLRQLEFRFNPYVEKATYYQFLAGSYFDSALLALSKWPSSKLCGLSIIQDPMPVQAPSQPFAQPIVFHRLDAMSSLMVSPLLSTITSLRFCLPQKKVIRPIAGLLGSAPNLESLDLSTSNVVEVDLDVVLTRFTKLKHIILDGCPILRNAEFKEEEWTALGKRCALVGVKRARDREKKLTAWLQTSMEANRSSRSGVAVLTKTATNITVVGIDPVSQKFRILPPPPILKSLSTTCSYSTPLSLIRAAWKKGWLEGLSQLGTAWNRLHSSSKNGVQVLRFGDSCGVDCSEDGFNGLEEMDIGSWELSDEYPVPALCLAGQKESQLIEHGHGCGHYEGAWV